MDANWRFSETSFDPCRMRAQESLFTIGNGVCCTRGAFEEGYPGETPATLVNGLYDDTATYQSELVNLPNWLCMQIWVGDEPFRMERGTILSYERSLDIYSGCLVRRVLWRSPNQATLEFQWKRWISLADPHMMGIRLRVKSIDYTGRLEVHGGLNGRVDNGGVRHWEMNGQGEIERSGGYLHLQTTSTNVEICQAFLMNIEEGQGVIADRHDSPWTPGTRLTMDIEAGQSVAIFKLVALFSTLPCSPGQSDIEHYGLVKTCISHLTEMATRGYKALFQEHKDTWEREWEDCALSIEGDPQMELAVRFNLYQLLIAAPRHLSYGGMSARGLSGLGYHGHIFWDSEIYMLPFLLYTRPDLARRMLLYRYHTLAGARANAREKGWNGSMFVWESAATGEETTPRWVPEKNGVELERIWSGDLSTFTTACVAWAVYRYWQVTGDDAFMHDFGAEILLDTARFWCERAEWNAQKNRYEFNDVFGPDEFHLHVNNNAFTNHLVYWNIKTAQDAWDWLCHAAPAQAERLETSLSLTKNTIQKCHEILSHLTLPIDPQSGLIEQYDGYFDLDELNLGDYEPRLQSMSAILGDQGCQKAKITRQPDVLLLLHMFKDLIDGAKVQNNWDYYAPRTDLSHGSSLGYSIHAALAARLGQPELAYRYLCDAARIDLENTFGNTPDGVHVGNAGGIWQALVLGMAGLDPYAETEYTLHPSLPGRWKKMTFSVVLRGKRRVIEIENPTYTPANHAESLSSEEGLSEELPSNKSDRLPVDPKRDEFDILLDCLPGMTYAGLADARRTMIDVNTYCYNLTGLHPAELIQGHGLSSLIHPHDREYVVKELQKACRTKQEYTLLYRIITTAQREKWVWENGRPPDGGGKSVAGQIRGRIVELTGRNTEFVALSGYAERSESLREIDQAILAAGSSGEVVRIALRALRRQGLSLRINLILLNLEENQAELFNMLDRSQEITSTIIQVTPEVRRWWHSVGLASRQKKLFISQTDIELCLDPQVEAFVEKFGVYNYLTRLESQGILLGILTLGSEKPGALTPALLSMANEVTNLLSIAITQRRLLEQLHTVNQNLQNLSRRLVDLQEQERRFLARELHDEIGQSLTAIKINLESMSSLPLSPDRKRLDDCVEVVSQTLQQVRNISLDLRPALLDELGLPATLRWYMDRLAQWNDIETQFQENLRQERLPVEIETTLFRVAQEALTNVIRHAGARCITVLLNQSDDLIRLQVKDNGHGFLVSEAIQAAVMGKSLGLLSIQERLHLIGGVLEIHSIPDAGTEVSAEVPYRQGVKRK